MTGSEAKKAYTAQAAELISEAFVRDYGTWEASFEGRPFLQEAVAHYAQNDASRLGAKTEEAIEAIYAEAVKAVFSDVWVRIVPHDASPTGMGLRLIMGEQYEHAAMIDLDFTLSEGRIDDMREVRSWLDQLISEAEASGR